MVEREFTAVSFNQYLNEKKLMGSKCKKCGSLFLPPKPICTDCRSEEMEWVQFAGAGKLAAFTSIAVGTTPMIQEGFDRNKPYCSGVVKLSEGPMISARILNVDAVHPEKIKVGTSLSVAFLERGEGENKRTVLAFKA